GTGRPRAREIAGALRARRPALAVLPFEVGRGGTAHRDSERPGGSTAGSRGAGPGGRRRGRPHPVSASSDLHAWLEARRVDVERALDAALPTPPACPSQL